MSHIEQCIHARNKLHMRLIVHEIRVCLDSGSYLVELIAVVQLNVNHTAVYARTGRNGH